MDMWEIKQCKSSNHKINGTWVLFKKLTKEQDILIRFDGGKIYRTRYKAEAQELADKLNGDSDDD